VQKARKLNAARGLLERHVPLPEAMRRLSRMFQLSGRQAYRYLEAASQLGISRWKFQETSVPITFEAPAPAHCGAAAEVSRSSGLTMGAIVTDALAGFLRKRKMHG